MSGSMSSVRMASISSRICIAPMAAVKAAPVRPATTMAVSSTASSRSTEMATRSTVKISALAGTAGASSAPPSDKARATLAPIRLNMSMSLPRAYVFGRP